jgi:molecular chaperone GrpE
MEAEAEKSKPKTTDNDKKAEMKAEGQEVETDKKDENQDSAEEKKEPEKTDKELLDEANKQIEELKDRYLRQLAEFDNYKKRTLKERAELILNGSAGAVTAILPVLDDMERAVANAGKSADAKTLEDGWELIYKKFINVLKGLGVNKIETKDKDFDTDYHEAVAMVPGQGDDKKGKVIDCLLSGYKLNDKVLRHAKVAVGQ